MKTKLALPILMLQLFTSSFAFAQTEIARNSEAPVLFPNTANETAVSMSMREPSFVGGNKALTEYIRNNVQYPEFAKKHDIEGTVTLHYSIKEDGTIENVKVVKSSHEVLNTEAIRLIENMPAWNPAAQNGSPTAVKYQLDVRFDLSF